MCKPHMQHVYRAGAHGLAGPALAGPLSATCVRRLRYSNRAEIGPANAGPAGLWALALYSKIYQCETSAGQMH